MSLFSRFLCLERRRSEIGASVPFIGTSPFGKKRRHHEDASGRHLHNRQHYCFMQAGSLSLLLMHLGSTTNHAR